MLANTASNHISGLGALLVLLPPLAAILVLGSFSGVPNLSAQWIQLCFPFIILVMKNF
jgi:hypothetical protein